jgi:hypothetical protein
MKKGIVIPMKKKAVLAALLTLTALFAAVIPVRADVIDPDVWDPYNTNSGYIEEEPVEPAEEPAPSEPEEVEVSDTEATPASPAPEPAPNNNRVDSEAKSLSTTVTALAAGLLIIAVAALIRAIVRNHREAKIDREMSAK